jgi:hypothetical protein
MSLQKRKGGNKPNLKIYLWAQVDPVGIAEGKMVGIHRCPATVIGTKSTGNAAAIKS